MSSSSLLLPVLLLFLATVPHSLSHNITTILADHREFSTFNHYLSATGLADDINHRRNITVLALDNPAMSSLLSRRFAGLRTLKDALSLHVLLGYFGAEELHQLKGGTALSPTISGSAEGAAPGSVNVSVRTGGKDATFCAEGSDEPPVSFVEAVKEIPYSIAVLQISAPLSSEALTRAPAPAPAPTPVSAPVHIEIFHLMSKKGCKTFADLLTAGAGAGSAAKTFEDNVATGLSVFCPVDRAMRAFLPKFNNLTAAGRMSALLYHGVPVYESMDTLLGSRSGLQLSTLATSTRARSDYSITVASAGEVVTLRTEVANATVTGTLVDDDPLAVYTIDRVLEPPELFEPPPPAKVPPPALPPALAPASRAPEGPSSKKKPDREVPVPTPAGPEPEPDDEMAADEEDASASIRVRHWAAAAAAAAAAVVLIT